MFSYDDDELLIKKSNMVYITLIFIVFHYCHMELTFYLSILFMEPSLNETKDVVWHDTALFGVHSKA